MWPRALSFKNNVLFEFVFPPDTENFQRHVGILMRKRDELVSVLELLLVEGSDPNCRQGSTGPMSEVRC